MTTPDTAAHGGQLALAYGLWPQAPAPLAASGPDDVGLHLDLAAASISDLAAHLGTTWSSVTLTVPSWAVLRTVLSPLRLLGKTSDVTVRVDEVIPPGITPALHPGVRPRVRVFRVTSRADEGTIIRVRLAQPAVLHYLVLAAAGRSTSLLTPAVRFGMQSRDCERFATGLPAAHYTGVNDTVDTGGVTVELTDFDVAVGGPVPEDPSRMRPLVILGPPDRMPARPVDVAAINPAGFNNTPPGRSGVAVWHADGLRISGDGDDDLVWLRNAEPWTARHIAALRPLPHIGIDMAGAPSADSAAEALCHLAAAGVPVVAGALPDPVRTLLAPDVVDALNGCTAAAVADPLLREAVSVRLRRAAMRSHGTAAFWRNVAERAGTRPQPLPTVSVLLLTKRPEAVEPALQQVAAQSYQNLQLVLGLHGPGFGQDAIARALSKVGCPHEVVRVDGEVPFGAALQQATDRCDGVLVTKWDDDDHYGSEHVWDLVLAAEYSQATVVGKVAEFTQVTHLVHPNGSEADVIVRRNAMGSEQVSWHVAGGALLLRRSTLAEIGGWRPVWRFVDDALLRQIRDAGGSIYRTHGFGYVLTRNPTGHTWDVGSDYFLEGDAPRWPAESAWRELALEQHPPAPS